MKKKRKKSRKRKAKDRSAVALQMRVSRRNAGPHKDKKKEAAREACRGDDEKST